MFFFLERKKTQKQTKIFKSDKEFIEKNNKSIEFANPFTISKALRKENPKICIFCKKEIPPKYKKYKNPICSNCYDKNIGQRTQIPLLNEIDSFEMLKKKRKNRGKFSSENTRNLKETK